tara:strand:+ start:1121 stop:1501 length:381 start_codon:yes stop_codon:yes gene_type:complete
MGDMIMKVFRVGEVSDFKNREKKIVIIDDQEVGIFRINDNFFAWKNQCPHQGGPVCQGRLFPLVKENLDSEMQSHGRIYDEKKLNIVCPWHGLEFDIETGEHPGNPKLKLDPITIEVNSDILYVQL